MAVAMVGMSACGEVWFAIAALGACACHRLGTREVWGEPTGDALRCRGRALVPGLPRVLMDSEGAGLGDFLAGRRIIMS